MAPNALKNHLWCCKIVLFMPNFITHVKVQKSPFNSLKNEPERIRKAQKGKSPRAWWPALLDATFMSLSHVRCCAMVRDVVCDYSIGCTLLLYFSPEFSLSLIPSHLAIFLIIWSFFFIFSPLRLVLTCFFNQFYAIMDYHPNPKLEWLLVLK